MKPLGIRDIVGPIMVGPSSSHTAGHFVLRVWYEIYLPMNLRA